jgi:hypothetical protein
MNDARADRSTDVNKAGPGLCKAGNRSRSRRRAVTRLGRRLRMTTARKCLWAALVFILLIVTGSSLFNEPWSALNQFRASLAALSKLKTMLARRLNIAMSWAFRPMTR